MSQTTLDRPPIFDVEINGATSPQTKLVKPTILDERGFDDGEAEFSAKMWDSVFDVILAGEVAVLPLDAGDKRIPFEVRGDNLLDLEEALTLLTAMVGMSEKMRPRMLAERDRVVKFIAQSRFLRTFAPHYADMYGGSTEEANNRLGHRHTSVIPVTSESTTIQANLIPPSLFGVDVDDKPYDTPVVSPSNVKPPSVFDKGEPVTDDVFANTPYTDPTAQVKTGSRKPPSLLDTQANPANLLYSGEITGRASRAPSKVI